MQIDSAEGTDIRDLMLLLLRDRHEYLDERVYGLIELRCADVMRDLKVIVCSDPMVRKLNGFLSSRSDMINQERQFLLLEDEIELVAAEEFTANLPPFLTAVAAGDQFQGKDRAKSRQYLTERPLAEVTVGPAEIAFRIGRG